ncbi:MAG: hypothetical protein IAI49_14120, partial [Candidatus Eremiobacteraeota bacterium]|nr:hypothetical protein [Candidatus Eremiobacteraeota bacterium]
KLQEAPTLRFSAIVTAASTLIFAANLALQIGTRPDADLETLHDFTVAGYIVLVPLLPMLSYFMWRRYLRAREAGALYSGAEA